MCYRKTISPPRRFSKINSPRYTNECGAVVLAQSLLCTHVAAFLCCLGCLFHSPSVCFNERGSSHWRKRRSAQITARSGGISQGVSAFYAHINSPGVKRIIPFSESLAKSPAILCALEWYNFMFSVCVVYHQLHLV